MSDTNTDTFDARGLLIHHIGPSTEWWKGYDSQGREVTYRRADGQVAMTTYDDLGAATTVWDPPIPGESLA